MTGRYERMFQRRQCALIPFLMIGDPDADRFLDHVAAVVNAGADALELGFPYSDPVADGPTVVAAANRALASGMTPTRCFEMLHSLRSRYPDLPIGLLVYANLVHARGLDAFYADAATSGVDSVLVPDAPLREVQPFIRCARENGIDQVLILPPDASNATLQSVAEHSSAYTYVLGRKGVTGTHQNADAPLASSIDGLKNAGAPPAVVGFGVSNAATIRSARLAGAAGVIVGSALIDAIASGQDAGGFIAGLAVATREEIQAVTPA